MYKYEMHLHSSHCSACAISSSQDMVIAAKKAGYTGIVFTNHFFHGNTAIDCSLPWKSYVKEYMDDYADAKNIGKSFDIDVLFGIETMYEPGKEALIYGIMPDLLAENPQFRDMNIAQISDFVHSHNGFIVSAHPFRHREYIPFPDEEPNMNYFDAIEVHNYFNSDTDNEQAHNFAIKNSLQVISGGDIHNMNDFGHSGLVFENRIGNETELVKALKEQKYKLIIKNSIL